MNALQELLRSGFDLVTFYLGFALAGAGTILAAGGMILFVGKCFAWLGADLYKITRNRIRMITGH